MSVDTKGLLADQPLLAFLESSWHWSQCNLKILAFSCPVQSTGIILIVLRLLINPVQALVQTALVAGLALQQSPPSSLHGNC